MYTGLSAWKSLRYLFMKFKKESIHIGVNCIWDCNYAYKKEWNLKIMNGVVANCIVDMKYQTFVYFWLHLLYVSIFESLKIKN